MGSAGQRIALWSAPVVGAIWLICFMMFPGFTTPMPPTLPAEAVAAFYADPDNLARARYGMILFNWFGIGFLPLTLIIRRGGDLQGSADRLDSHGRAMAVDKLDHHFRRSSSA